MSSKETSQEEQASDFNPELQPFTEQQKGLINHYLFSREAYGQAAMALEDNLNVPLDHYQQKRLFYQDVSDLAHFRRNFFDTVGSFLQYSFDTTYQLEIWDRQFHSKYNYSQSELRQAGLCKVKMGTAVETITYGKLGFKVRRSFEIEHEHLFGIKSQFYVAGKQVPWVDGLMLLQHQLKEHTLWLKGYILKIEDFT